MRTYLVVGDIISRSDYSGRLTSGLNKTEIKADSIEEAIEGFKQYWKNPQMGVKNLVDVKVKKVFELVWN